ncbi:MAG TPA: WecB/TagA/CpsF family glycosyltransferase, partial [Methylomirabilota bacterium]|nr:WecB/TagA/CpsF family glycosyltransferase [Methylomirabilota bacterium]
TGADLVVPLARAAALTRVPIFLFGTTADALDSAADRLMDEAPGIRIAGLQSPPLGFDPFGVEARKAVAEIEASGASICFVALGAPKQELFANAAVCRSSGVVYVCVGAALDFLAGTQVRAPLMMRDLGMEWVWRLAWNPRRMFSRYVRSALYLVRHIVSTSLGEAKDEPPGRAPR